MNHLLSEGLTLMLLGMGAVFVFLTLLVFATSLMSRLVAQFSPAPAPVAAPVPPASPTSSEDNQQLLAVITAAIHKYRSRQK
ncbi:MAG: OadG family transporter subunit [Ketobacteraceae bacterium]|nr:OadG family transporter subunit [Ketobacteraceae bacterium]